MTELTVPARTVTVLDRPLTRAEYDTAPDKGTDGFLTRAVSLSLHRLTELDYDDNVEELCAAVVSELGEDWQLASYRVVGADPRPGSDPDYDPGAAGVLVLLEISMHPGDPE